MFLGSVSAGLISFLSSPWPWVGAAAYSVVHSLVVTARARASERWGEDFLEGRRLARYGLYAGWLASELLDVLAVVLVVGLLVPHVLDPPALPPDWSPPATALQWFAATAGATVVLVIWRWVPVLGSLLELVPPLATYVVGIWALHVLVDAARTNSVGPGADLPFPGLLPTSGFFTVAVVPYFFAAYLALDWDEEEPVEALSPAGAFLLRLGGTFAGLVPLFMYGAWITRSLAG